MNVRKLCNEETLIQVQTSRIAFSYRRLCIRIVGACKGDSKALGLTEEMKVDIVKLTKQRL